MSFTDRHTNARTRELYTATWDLLGQYCTDIDTIAFSDISRQWLEGFDLYLSKRGNNANTRSIHIRNIRAVFNDAMDAGITVAYPFRRLVPKPVPKKKVILSPMQLRTLFSAEVPDHQRKYIDAFKLMFLLIGINTVDLLTTATIQNGRVVYIRAKTHRPYSVKLEPEAADIIARYPSSRGHLISLGDGLKDYRGVTYRMNEALKSVIPGVTTYPARYSWATIAASLDIPKETIARALGHGGHSVTDIYIDFDQGKVDDANRRVIDWVLYGRK
jgi:site-specific recombinase XerD